MKIPKNLEIFSKNYKLLSDKQLLPPQMPDFATTRAMTAATRKILLNQFRQHGININPNSSFVKKNNYAGFKPLRVNLDI